MKDPKGRTETGYRMHAFVCGHSRDSNASRPSCSASNSLDLMRMFKQAARDAGLNDVRVQKSGCLDFCEFGPTCVIYPEGNWFRITEEAIPDLVEYLDGGSIPVQHKLELKA